MMMHPSSRELLLAADGELSARRTAKIRKHLANCSACRLCAREFQTALTEYSDLFHPSLDARLPPVAGSRAMLSARLDQAVEASRWVPPWMLPLAVGLMVLIAIAIPYAPSRRTGAAYAGFIPVSFPTTTLTPGVARPVNRQQLCESNDGKNRDVPIGLQRRVFALYGITNVDPHAYEVDYLITPALGGADDIGNLWPQSYSATVWNAGVKDALEDRLHEMVCRGEIDLPTAQREISSDWIAAYRKYFGTNTPVN